MKELMLSYNYRRSSTITNVDIADLTSCHDIMPRFSPSLFQHTSITQTIFQTLIYILVKTLTSTDRYWWSYGSAKFDVAMESFEAKLRRAITSLISRFNQHIIHLNVDNTIKYHRRIRGEKVTTLWYSIIQITCDDGWFQYQTSLHQSFVNYMSSTAIFILYCR